MDIFCENFMINRCLEGSTIGGCSEEAATMTATATAVVHTCSQKKEECCQLWFGGEQSGNHPHAEPPEQ